MKINTLLTKYFCEYYQVDLQKDYKIEEIDAMELIVPERIDLIAKYKYIEYREKGYDLTFIKKLYKSHIEAFSKGTYTEPGNEQKNSIKKYFSTFDQLIDSIKNNGIDPHKSVIPVGKNNAIMDGAHRVAIAAYFGHKVPIVRFNDLSANYNANYFRESLLEERYIDYLVTEYCKLKNNVYLACVWPKGKGKRDEITEKINKVCKIVNEKNISLNYTGVRNLMIQIYGHQEWVGNFENHFSGVNSKAVACYDKKGLLTTYLLECKSFDKILKLKEDIRDIFKIEKHSIHITDNKEETVQMANILFNQNSIDFLRKGMPDHYTDFNRKLKEFKSDLLAFNLPLDEFVIDSSSTLGLYGLRNVGDIDFMSICNNYKLIEKKDVSNNHNYLNLYESTADNIVLNPNNYFYYNDMKFVSLNLLRKFKKNRNQEKDKLDIKLIDSVLGERKNINLLMLKTRRFISRKRRNISFKLHNNKLFIINKGLFIIRKFGIYEITRTVYRSLRYRG